MVTRTTTEIKCFRIFSPSRFLMMGQGDAVNLPYRLWYEGIFISEEEATARLTEAQESARNSKNCWYETPKIEYFWRSAQLDGTL